MTIFVNYRRTDSVSITGRIADHLVDHFGKSRVYRDVDSIPVGADFVTHIELGVSRCKVFIAIIGPNWVSDRLGQADDFVRLEIETALLRSVPMIPVLVEGASMPAKGQLPDSLHAMLRHQAVRVDSGVDFGQHIGRLIANIEISWPAVRWRKRGIKAAKWAAGGGALLAGVLTVRAWSTDGPERPDDHATLEAPSPRNTAGSTTGATTSTSMTGGMTTTTGASGTSSSSGASCVRAFGEEQKILDEVACLDDVTSRSDFCEALAKVLLPGSSDAPRVEFRVASASASVIYAHQCTFDVEGDGLRRGLVCQLAAEPEAGGSGGVARWTLDPPRACAGRNVVLELKGTGELTLKVTKSISTFTPPPVDEPQCPPGCFPSSDGICRNSANVPCL